MLGSIFGRTLRLLRAGGLAPFGIAAAVFVPTDLLVAVIDSSRGWGDSPWTRWVPALVISGIAWWYAYAAVIARTAIGSVQAFGRVWSRLAPLAVVGLAVSVGTCGGMVLLVVPGLLLAVWWSVAAQAVVLEDNGARAALGRSRALARGSFWPILLLVVLESALYLVLDYAVWRAASAGLPGLAGAWLSGAVVDTVTLGLIALVFTALFHELRDRQPSTTELPAPS